MSAQLQNAVAAATSLFTANLQLEAGVTVYVQAPSMHGLRNIVARLQPTEPANDAGNVPAATALVGQPASQTAAPSAQPVAAAAVGDVGNASASTATQGSVPPAASGSASGGEQGNASAGAQTGASSAQPASTDKPSASPEVTFDVLKKAFLALSTKPAGREKCEAVLKPFGLAKLSAATPEQYAAVLAEIEKAGK